jgi:hypothetical protein
VGRARIAVAAIAAAACHEPPGAAFSCECTVLTDFDDAAKQATRVCASSAERADVMARTCAREEGAPAPVQACACTQVTPPRACRVGDCLAER